MASEYEKLVSVEDLLKNLWEQMASGSDVTELKPLLEDAQSQLHEVVLQYPAAVSNLSREHPLVPASRAALEALREEYETYVECHSLPSTGEIPRGEDQAVADEMKRRIDALEAALGPFGG